MERGDRIARSVASWAKRVVYIVCISIHVYKAMLGGMLGVCGGKRTKSRRWKWEQRTIKWIKRGKKEKLTAKDGTRAVIRRSPESSPSSSCTTPRLVLLSSHPRVQFPLQFCCAAHCFFLCLTLFFFACILLLYLYIYICRYPSNSRFFCYTAILPRSSDERLITPVPPSLELCDLNWSPCGCGNWERESTERIALLKGWDGEISTEKKREREREAEHCEIAYQGFVHSLRFSTTMSTARRDLSMNFSFPFALSIFFVVCANRGQNFPRQHVFIVGWSK